MKEKYNHVLTIRLFLPLLFDIYFQAAYLELLMLRDYHTHATCEKWKKHTINETMGIYIHEFIVLIMWYSEM